MTTFNNDLVRFFGITQDINECGYILDDGLMLDFSGRHLAIGVLNHQYKQGRKSLGHSLIYGINKDGYCFTNDYGFILTSKHYVHMEIMNRSKALRIAWDSFEEKFCIHLLYPPTLAQLETLANKLAGEDFLMEQTTIDDMSLCDYDIVDCTLEKLLCLKWHQVEENTKESTTEA